MSVQLATAPSHPVFVECVSCTTSGGEEDQTYQNQRNVEDSVSLKDSGSTSMSEISISAGSGLALVTNRAMDSLSFMLLSKRQYLHTAWPMKHSGAQGFSTTVCTDATTHHAAIPFTSTMGRSRIILWTLFGQGQQRSFGQIIHGREGKPMGWRSSQSRAFARFDLDIRMKESASSGLPKNMVWPRLKSATSSSARHGGTSSNGVG